MSMESMAPREMRFLPGLGFARKLGRIFASDHLTLFVLGLLAAVLVGATVYEARHGAELARWYVYDAGWFSGLLGLLAANLAASALVRFPWRREDVGYLLVRVGLVALLVGLLRSSLEGIEGRLVVGEGEVLRAVTLPHRSQLTVSWAEQPEVPNYQYRFDGGPLPWMPGQTLDLGNLDGVRARVLRYFPHARAILEWRKDASERGGPYVRFGVSQPGGEPLPNGELADEGFGDELTVGPLVVRLERATSASFLEDFLAPPPRAERAAKWGASGQLRVYYEDQRQTLSVADQIGKKVAIGETGIRIEIVRYLPHARPDAHGQFHPGSDEPRNPIVELDVYLPDASKPRRQIAWAKQPLLNLDGVVGSVCPVKFRFDHPAVAPSPGVEFCQAADGTLYARVIQDGEYRIEKVESTAQKLKLPAGFDLQLFDYLPHAQRAVHFEAAGPEALDTPNLGMPGGAAPPPDAAAEVEIETGESRQRVWVVRNRPLEGAPVVATPDGPLRVHFETATRPLGFALRLAPPDADATSEKPARAVESAPVLVATNDDAESPAEDVVHVVAPDRPLRHGGFAIYAPTIEDAGHGKRRAVFSVVYDPGRTLKHLGALVACLGGAWLVLRRRTPRVAIASSSITEVKRSATTDWSAQRRAA